MNRFTAPLAAAALLATAVRPALGADWPTYRHDNRRSGVTPEPAPTDPALKWTWRSPLPPQTAWSAPARWDAFTANENLQSMRNFDPVFFVTAAEGQVWFGSSVDHAVHALEAATGRERWVAFTGGPVRLPPTWHRGRLYFGSDDGRAWCVNADDGRVHWSYRPVMDDRLIPSNGALISRWPCRTGVLVQDGTAYFGASLLPWQPSYLCAVDAETGRPEGPGRYRLEQEGMTLQGALLAARDTLYAPQGRNTPLRFRIADGARGQAVYGMGGVYCILTAEEQLVAGPNSQKAPDRQLRIGSGSKGSPLLTFPRANRMLIAGATAYAHQGRDLAAVDLARYRAGKAAKRGDAEAWRESARWKRPHPVPLGYALAGSTLLVGGENRVSALDAQTGAVRWERPVEGRAYGLAVAGGRLFVSTDRGAIHCFE